MSSGASLFILIYIFPAFFIAFVFGTARRIGFWLSFLACLVTTPLIGFLLTLLSEKTRIYNDRQTAVKLQKEQLDTLKSGVNVSITEELARLNELKNTGAITYEEFRKMKSKIIW